MWICAYVFSETLFSTTALGSVLLLDVRSIARVPGVRRIAPPPVAIAAGVVTGLAMLVRPAMTVLSFRIAAVWLLASTPRELVGVPRRRRAAGRDAVDGSQRSRLPPLRPDRVRRRRHVLDRQSPAGDAVKVTWPRIRTSSVPNLRFGARPGLTAEQLEPLYYRDAIHYILAHPFWWAGLLARKVFYTVVPVGPSYTLHSVSYVVASVALYLVLLPLAAWGWRSRRYHRRPEALFVLAASSVLAGLVFFPQERFRIPVIDPALIVCAAAACADRWNR